MTGAVKGRCAAVATGACAILVLLVPALAAQDAGRPGDASEAPLQARVWLDRGDNPAFRKGETARLYYSASRDAFVAIFHIDTDGGARLVFPRSPDENPSVRGSADYRLLFPRSPYWTVEDEPGVGYFFLVASPWPLDFSAFAYSHFDHGWDISRVGRHVYRDPHLAMADYARALAPDGGTARYALDFVSYHVDGRHEYPRFLCYDCHGFRPYSAWNPYHFACSNFRVVVYGDPFDYPASRYGGGSVVYAPRSDGPSEARFDFKERAAYGMDDPLQGRARPLPVLLPAPALPSPDPAAAVLPVDRARPVLEPRPPVTPRQREPPAPPGDTRGTGSGPPQGPPPLPPPPPGAPPPGPAGPSPPGAPDPA